MTHTVGLATADDVADLASLRASWTAGEDRQAQPEFEETFAEWFARESSHRRFWIARSGSGAIGMVNLTVFERMPRPDGRAGAWGHLGNMFVRASARRRGVGADLLTAALAHADSAGLVRVVLNPTEVSVALYRNRGFRDDNGLLVRPLPSGATTSRPSTAR